MKIKIGQVVDQSTQKRLTCGILEFKFSDDQPEILFLDEESVSTANGKRLFFSSTYELSSNNISVFIREGETHIFTGILNLSYIATYLAFTTLDGTFTELFFEK